MSRINVVIVGAPRSGTNMLRDMLVKLPKVGTWPCDEINYIWRHGNVRYPSDAFTRDMAAADVKRYIHTQFDQLAKSHQLDMVVEKTCTNSLRVGFVDEVLPDAKYIFIVRDGVDVVGSAMLRWKASLDIPYLLAKARYVPIVDLPYYASKYLSNRLYRLISKEKRLASWGPKLDDMDAILKNYSLLQVCALQWKACVNKSEEEFSRIDPERVVRVKYEDLVSHPHDEFLRIAKFLGQEVTPSILNGVTQSVSIGSVGKGRAALGASGLAEILPLINETLAVHGYKV
ncbi:MAG: sulfotransferase [Thiothrix sp.]|uniref:sulfotransferase family protein n=1 Tax=Thiothrix sp. TaxID=1032 RepID=UPI002635DE1C|nr:sulfotransferase [Thiothrix sp.]MDD5395542.1 sulfotransferase [Thiothrix sp.]